MRRLYHDVGMPTVENFKALLRGNLIWNYPVTTEDVKVVEKIFGLALSSLKGKATRSKPTPVVEDTVKMSSELIEKNKEVDLCMDTMFINKQGMLMAIDWTVRFRSLIPINSKKPEEYYHALDVIFRKYNAAGFII